MKQALRATAVALCLAGPSLAVGETLYVTDQLEITLRTGPGTSYKITEMLVSGTPLDGLEEAEGWTRVRGQGGKEGWVLSRYLTSEPPKGPRLAAALKEVEELRAQNERLRGELGTTGTELGRVREEANRRGERLDGVEREFSAWKTANQDVIALRARSEALEKEQAASRAELERLRAENRGLQAREKFYWFFSGVVVLLLGWALGYVYASSRYRAKGHSRFRM